MRTLRKEKVARGDAHVESFAIKLNDYINDILGKDLIIDVFDMGEIQIHVSPKLTYKLILDRFPKLMLYCKKEEVGKGEKDLFQIDSFNFNSKMAKSIVTAIKEDIGEKDISLK